MRTLEQVTREIEDAEAEHSALSRRLAALRGERDELALAAVDHPWLGKKVVRTKVRGFRNKPTTNRGVVTAYDPKKHRGLRSVGSSYGMKAGDLIVLHPGGLTGWKFHEYDWASKSHRCDWVLDEKAQAGEAGTAETVKQGSVHEHAVAASDAPKGEA